VSGRTGQPRVGAMSVGYGRDARNHPTAFRFVLPFLRAQEGLSASVLLLSSEVDIRKMSA
jgi:hypothetical protein